MSFRQGVSTSPANLVSQISSFITTVGAPWSVIRSNGAGGDPAGTQLTIEDTAAAVGTFYSMIPDNSPSNDANVQMQPHTADSGIGASFFAHTGSPDATGSSGTFSVMGNGLFSTTDQGFVGPHTQFFLFEGATGAGRYLHVVVEGTAGVYFHMWMGTIEKAGTFTGGQYTAASYAENANQVQWPGQFAPTTTRGTQWFRFDNAFTSGSPGWREMNWFAFFQGSGTSLPAGVYEGGLNEFNQRTPFSPILCPFWANDTPSIISTNWKLAGHIPDCRLVSMDGREPGETITLGSDTWHIFPVHRKTTDGISTTSAAYNNTNVTGSAPNNDSNMAGYAYREVGPTI